ncbi:MAG TPA: hypothetical protein VGQ17_02520 [Gemmatimonadales bacterium]|jgi:hypothetical protein|nr:hypothetical protein [Gemmatimonadales bacterium]
MIRSTTLSTLALAALLTGTAAAQAPSSAPVKRAPKPAVTTTAQRDTTKKAMTAAAKDTSKKAATSAKKKTSSRKKKAAVKDTTTKKPG